MPPRPPPPLLSFSRRTPAQHTRENTVDGTPDINRTRRALYCILHYDEKVSWRATTTRLDTATSRASNLERRGGWNSRDARPTSRVTRNDDAMPRPPRRS